MHTHGTAKTTGGADPAVDRVRLIRRSVRCGVFGLVGLIPIAGLGLAIQALRLYQQVMAESRGVTVRPTVSWTWLSYWLVALGAVYGHAVVWGFPASVAAFLALVLFYLWLPRLRRPALTPAGRLFRLPLAAGFWIVGILFMMMYGLIFGFVAGVAMLLGFLGLQSWQLYRTLPYLKPDLRNPAEHYVWAGAVLGYAGILGSIGISVLIAVYFRRLADS